MEVAVERKIQLAAKMPVPTLVEETDLSLKPETKPDDSKCISSSKLNQIDEDPNRHSEFTLKSPIEIVSNLPPGLSKEEVQLILDEKLVEIKTQYD